MNTNQNTTNPLQLHTYKKKTYQLTNIKKNEMSDNIIILKKKNCFCSYHKGIKEQVRTKQNEIMEGRQFHHCGDYTQLKIRS